MSGNLKDKLARMRGETRRPTLARSELSRRLERTQRAPVEELAGELTTGPPEGLVLQANERGGYFERVTYFATDHLHGEWRLNEVFEADTSTCALLTGDGSLREVRLKDAVFLDTETTGLSGGAGTYVFQVGLGRFTEDGFELWQGFLSGPEDEPGLLQETARRILDAGSVVSFFGKSFDRHRLEDKMRLHAVDPPFESRPHLDLYHPLRRIYKGCFDDCKLKTLELQLSGLVRPDDLPGSFAPAAWFDFLQNRPHRLEGVFQHNANDVLSLVTLAAYLGRIESGTRAGAGELGGSELDCARALARALIEAKREDEAREWITRALNLEPTRAESRQLRFANALSLKRSKLPCEAWGELETLLAEPHDTLTVPASIEAAMLLEHRLKDRKRALELCEAALALCENFHFGTEYARFKRDLDKRIARLALDSGTTCRDGQSSE